MHRDLLDALRCPAGHEESWLVVMVHEANDAWLIAADLACPVCGAEYPVRDGVADFVDPAAKPGHRSRVVRIANALAASRTAALLGVMDPIPPVVLYGHQDVEATTLATMHVGDRLPLGAGTMAGVTFDTDSIGRDAEPGLLAEAVRVVRQGGRIVAPAQVAVPPDVRELARDADEWVAEVTTRASGLIALRRRAPDVTD